MSTNFKCCDYGIEQPGLAAVRGKLRRERVLRLCHDARCERQKCEVGGELRAFAAQNALPIEVMEMT